MKAAAVHKRTYQEITNLVEHSVSVTDEAGFIEVKGNKRIFHFKTMKFPCRTLHEELPDSVDLDEFDINEHIALLESGSIESEEWSI